MKITVQISTAPGAKVTVSEETYIPYVPEEDGTPQNAPEEAQDSSGDDDPPAPETVDLSDWEESGLGEQPRHTFEVGDLVRITQSDGIDFDFQHVDDPVVQVTFLLPDDYLDTGDDIIAEEVSRRLEAIAFEYGASVHDVTVRR